MCSSHRPGRPRLNALVFASATLTLAGIAGASGYSAAELSLGGDSASASAAGGLIVGTGRLPGGENHAFLYSDGGMHDLGTLGGMTSSASAIDAQGNVYGSAQRADGSVGAFVYSNGHMTDLGSFGLSDARVISVTASGTLLVTASSQSTGVERGFLYRNGTTTDLGLLGGEFLSPEAINSNDEVVGAASVSPGASAPGHAFLYSGGTLSDLAGFSGPVKSAIHSAGVGVTDAGQVFGNYTDAFYNARSFIFDGAQTLDIGTLGGETTTSTAENAAGEIIGQSTTASHVAHAFAYTDAGMLDLGTLGGATSKATAINSAGQIAGVSDMAMAGESHAFLYANGHMADLGTLGGKASSASVINEFGDVAGNSTPISGAAHAFLYHDGTMRDLGTLGGDRSRAIALNDAGQVAGSSKTAGGETRGFAFIHGAVMQIPTPNGDEYVSGVAGNASGLIAAVGSNSAGRIHAFAYQDGQSTDIGALLTPEGATRSFSRAVNSANQVVGVFQHPADAGTEQDVFVYRAGQPLSIIKAPTGGTADIRAINDNGQILGSVSAGIGYLTYPFIYSTATGQTKILDADAQYGTITTRAVAINESGDAVYNAENLGSQEAILYHDGAEDIIGYLPGFAYTTAKAMNNHDEVVGNAQPGNGGFGHAFLFSNGQTIDLGDAFSMSSSADDINEAGAVLGEYQVAPQSNASPYTHAFLYSDGTFLDLNEIGLKLPTGWVLTDASFCPGSSDILATGQYGTRTSMFLLSSVPEPIGAVTGAMTILALLAQRRRRTSSPQPCDFAEAIF